MKVFFVGNNFDGCYYVRCLLPLVYNGWDGDKTSLRSRPIDREISAKKMLQADVIVFQRPDEMVRVQVAKYLKRLGKKIVFENDDTYKIDEARKLGEILVKRSEAIDEFIKIADLVTTTTDFLADEYRKLNDNVIVLPNCVDPFDWDKPLRNETDIVRIGFVGSVTANGDYDSVKETLYKLNRIENVKLVVFGLPPVSMQTEKVRKVYKEEIDFWNTLNIEWQPLVTMADYFSTLNKLRLDLMIIPRKDNYFNRCKSNIKFLEASMLEIPVVAQGFSDGNSPYQNDGDYMKIVTGDNWYDEIMELVNYKDKRRFIGAKAKQYVLNNFNINNKASLWKEAYESLCK